MARSRKTAWLRDELILALDLYRRAGRKPSLPQLDELSATLRSMPIERELALDPAFRGRDSVHLKLANFVSLDPDAGVTGMTRGGAEDKRVWEEFAEDPLRLERLAEAIRENLASPPPDPDLENDANDEASEGRILERVHRSRERNRGLVARKKAQVLAATGKVACTTCGFDFATTYGTRGDGFIECHHTKPLSELKPNAKTRLSDLALVCANCHRMIHRRSPWLSLSELRALVADRQLTAKTTR